MKEYTFLRMVAGTCRSSKVMNGARVTKHSISIPLEVTRILNLKRGDVVEITIKKTKR